MPDRVPLFTAESTNGRNEILAKYKTLNSKLSSVVLLKTFTTDRTVVHPEWNGDLLDGYDLALIQLNRASGSPLPDLDTQGSSYTSGSVFSTLGWGFDSSGVFTDRLQIADPLPFVESKICNRTYWNGQIKDSMICAGIGDGDTAEGNVFYYDSEFCSSRVRFR